MVYVHMQLKPLKLITQNHQVYNYEHFEKSQSNNYINNFLIKQQNLHTRITNMIYHNLCSLFKFFLQNYKSIKQSSYINNYHEVYEKFEFINLPEVPHFLQCYKPH